MTRPSTTLNNAADQVEYVADTPLVADLLRETVSHGKTFRFSAKGRSMEPFIRSGDTISIALFLPETVRLGDVLAFLHPLDGRLLVHRLIQKKGNTFLIKADNVREHNDGWVSTNQLLGRVNQVERGDRKISFGLGVEKNLIALLSRWDWLVPILNRLRSLKHLLQKIIY